MENEMNDGCHGLPGPGGMLQHLQNLMGAKHSDPADWIHVGFLTEDEVKLFNNLQAMTTEAEILQGKIQATKDKFWGDVRLRMNAFQTNLKLDEETQSILALKTK